MDDFKKILSGGIGVALATCFIYALAYSFNVGKLEHYGIPTEYVRVNPIDIINVIGILIGILSSIGILLLLFLFYFPKRLIKIITALAALFIMGNIFLAPFSFLQTLGPLSKPLGEIMGLMTIMLGIAIFIWTAYLAITKKEVPNELDKIVDKIPNSIQASIGVLLVIIWLIPIVRIMGNLNSAIETTYTVTDTKPEMVILQSSGDIYLLAQFDRKQHTIGNAYKIIPMSEISNITLKKEILGSFKKIK
jgi:hypothetical protein